MILTRNWLSKFINLKDVTNQQISIALNSLGFEVEEEHDIKTWNDQLVIGYVEESQQIEGTHLRFNKVNVGNHILEIVCGAPNVNAKQFVIVAQPGQTIANGLTLGERKIRGYKSQGMICALNEIGIKNSFLSKKEADSIYEIHSANITKDNIGKSINAIGFDDYIWDMDLTLDRSDALGATQLIKEIANYFKLNIDWNYLNPQTVSSFTSNAIFEVESDLNKDINTLAFQEFCIKNQKFVLEAADDIWLKLNNVKTKENNFEDLANIVAIESGQPIILIDQTKIRGSIKLELKNLEGKDFICLTNQNKIINIIGQDIEQEFKVSETTEKVMGIYLNLNTNLMRKQQKNLDISNTFTQRFMKPLNSNLFEFSSKVLVANLERYNLLTSLSSIYVVIEKPNTNNVFKISLKKINDFLGTNLSSEKIKKLFRTLDISISGNDEELIFTVDLNRTDLYGKYDICEEIARLYGYDNIQEVAPTIIARENTKKTEAKIQNKISDYLIGLGFNNTKTYSLLAKEEVLKWNLFKLKEPVNLMSPLSKLHETYRLSLISSLIEVSAFNSAIDNKKVKLWETADVYTNDLQRQKHLAILVSGDVLNDKMNDSSIVNNYFYLKGVAENIFSQYKLDASKITYSVLENVIDEIHPYVNAEIKFKDEVLGYIFQVNPKHANIKKISKTFGLELNLSIVEKNSEKIYSVKALSKFQHSTRDISLLLNNEIKYEDVIKQLTAGVNNLINIKLIDEYTDEKLIKQNQKSLAISFTFNNVDKQMDEKDITTEWSKILNNANLKSWVVR
ncbi:phenylalanyl-tRNA synthetase subunit beta [Williamsoniiplasma somnilux]|uniref:Phenylalanine--tRNA ligase beta subunit n=1 Tax=Williamsoniiplasma somnilux TaxID=215578 RepID=A0A2K8NXV3_9MOLU|nr:phenylalanine--tRNA ligase subunit beta [Williamsoniiplasma somnilux]ATZ18650.1 phenylalanyl-tRNA synthetase subunit beta [Williamsoniiplasma somnilux]